MANGLFDGRKMRPKPLRPQVQLGAALTVWQGVNEVPPLVSLKRQVPFCVGMQHRTHPRDAIQGMLHCESRPNYARSSISRWRVGPQEQGGARQPNSLRMMEGANL